MSEKPYLGRIERWHEEPCDGGLGYQIVGTFIDHPTLEGERGHTSAVVKRWDTGRVETMNSLYKLVGPSTRDEIVGREVSQKPDPLERAARQIDKAVNSLGGMLGGREALNELLTSQALKCLREIVAADCQPVSPSRGQQLALAMARARVTLEWVDQLERLTCEQPKEPPQTPQR